MIRKHENETSEQFLKRIAEYNKIPFVVSYGYPSSPIAEKLGMGRTGCYYVEDHHKREEKRRGFTRVVGLKGYPREEDAQAVADQLNMEVGWQP